MSAQVEIAATILGHVKAGTGRFREDKAATLWCDRCPRGIKPRRLLRIFHGTADDGTARTWLLTSRYKTGTREVPAAADVIPLPGEPAFTRTAMCPRCSSGWVIMHRELAKDVQRQTAGNPRTLYFRVGDEGSWRNPWTAGDEAYALTISERSEWADGPGPMALLRIDTPVFATVQP